MKVVYITGYKAFEYGIFKNDHEGVKYIKKAIEQRLLQLVEDGLEWVLITGQLGTELWAAEIVFELQKEYQELKLAVITPYLNQEEKWKENNREFYDSILAQADFVDSVYKSPYEGPQQLKMKNLFMVHKSEGMIIVFDEERDGSPKYAFADAKKRQHTQEYPIIQITFDDLQQAAEDEQWSR